MRLYAQLAIDSARSIDSLFTDSLMPLAKDLSSGERNELVKARDAALVSIHGFADWLERRLPGMVPFKRMGEENYNYILKNIYLLTLDAKQVEMLGQAELARYRALESLLRDPSLADPSPARSKNIPADQHFYIRAAIEDPRPILGHEGIPGHFLQLSIANHLPNEIRRQHGDGIFIEGWALYGEEMLMRTGLYPENSPGQGQILRLSRYRAARIGVDVNLHTGRWTFDPFNSETLRLNGASDLKACRILSATLTAPADGEDNRHDCSHERGQQTELAEGSDDEGLEIKQPHGCQEH